MLACSANEEKLNVISSADTSRQAELMEEEEEAGCQV